MQYATKKLGIFLQSFKARSLCLLFYFVLSSNNKCYGRDLGEHSPQQQTLRIGRRCGRFALHSGADEGWRGSKNPNERESSRVDIGHIVVRRSLREDGY